MAEQMFSGKVALVSGAARRIGLAIARRLAADGAGVVVHANSSRQAAEAGAKEIVAAGGKAIPLFADVTDPASVEALIAGAVDHFGRLDMVVHNAVSPAHGTLEALDFEAWREGISVILDGAFLLSKFAAPHMEKGGGGSIVYIGGTTAFVGSASVIRPTGKAGLVGLARSLALALGPQGIRVNVVSPGRIDAPEDAPERQAANSGTRPVERIPLRRAGAPEDIADAVAAICGHDMRYVTGQTIHATGGFYMG
jgi:3-oxoacyl-[acyl-carrier protein] reductase